MASRSRHNPLLDKPYEFPEFWDYSPERGAVKPRTQRTTPTRPKAKRDELLARRDYRLAQAVKLGEKSFLYGMVKRIRKAERV